MSFYGFLLNSSTKLRTTPTIAITRIIPATGTKYCSTTDVGVAVGVAVVANASTPKAVSAHELKDLWSKNIHFMKIMNTFLKRCGKKQNPTTIQKGRIYLAQSKITLEY